MALALLMVGCGDLPAEAQGSATTAPSTGVLDDSSDGPDATTTTTTTTNGSSGADPDSSGSSTDGGSTETTAGESDSSSGGPPVEPRPNCGDGLVAMNELCHELGPAIALGLSPERIGITDFDGDGTQDLIVGEPTSAELVVLWGVGDGNFVAPQPFLTADAPIDDFAVTDLSGDGWPDLVLTDRANFRLIVFAGDGAGGVFFAGLYPADLAPLRLHLGFINDDPIVDVVASGTTTLSVMHGNGLAGFLPSQTLPIATGPHWLGLFDLDFDGQRDLVTVNRAGTSVSTFSNIDGVMQEPDSFTTASLPQGMAIGDIDGNGTPDLLVAHSSADTVGILLGDGAGGFSEETTVDVTDDPQAVALADLDSDGALDLAVAHNPGDALVLHKGAGDGTFTKAPSLFVEQAADLRAADFNGDGVPDLVVLRPADEAIQVLVSAP